MSKIEEMVETFLDGASFLRNSVAREAAHAGLRAVLEKHVKAMVARAFEDGWAVGADIAEYDTPPVYAERVISELTAEGTRPEVESLKRQTRQGNFGT